MRGGLVLFLVFLAGPAEAAKQTAAPNRFGAIAYHRASQAWGVSFDQERARDAALEALRQCGHARCEIVVRLRNGCGAVANGPRKFAAGRGATREEAETKALKGCGAGCDIVVWACTK